MPIIITALGVLGTVVYFMIRARGAAEAASTLIDAVADVPLAVRRITFRRKANTHPVECIDDPTIAIAALTAAFVELETIPVQDQWDRLTLEIARNLNVAGKDAEELALLGRWLADQCGTVDAAVSRLSRKVFKLAGIDRVSPLFDLITAITGGVQTAPNANQRQALADMRRAMHVR